MSSQIEYSTSSLRLMRFLMGFLIVLGLILVEIGIADIYLDKDTKCREAIPSGRIIVDPHTICTSEVGIYFLNALSRGPFAAERSEVPDILAWVVMGLSYGIVAGFLAQFPQRTAIVVFIVIHIVALISFTVIAYVSTFIV